MRVIPLDPALDARCCEQCGVGLVRRKRESPQQWVARRLCSKVCMQAARVERTKVAFWDKVERGGPDGCWPWTGRLTSKGYGEYSLRAKSIRAHRLALELSGVEIPTGMVVMHSCDNPPCCNPAHLAVGTTADNNRDMMSKGRFRHWQSKEPAL